MTLRVVQWTTGNVARASLRSIIARDDMELVGVYAHTADKVGKDAGRLAGLGRDLGITATDDVGAILALRPDCVAYMPLYPDIDHLCLLLASGVNVVTTSEFMTGAAVGRHARDRLDRAASDGGASLFGSGVNPGWIEYIAAVASGVARDLDSIRITESFDLAFLSADSNQDDFGWGRPAGDPGHADDVAGGVAEFRDAAEAMAAVLGVTLDDIRYDVQFAHATRDLDVAGRSVRKGSVAGIDITWYGVVDGHDLLELNARWTLCADIEPAWDTLMGYLIEVRANPNVVMRVDFVPQNLENATMESLAAVGTTLTAQPAVNAIPAVVAARPGIVTYADLPPMTANIVRAHP